KPVRVMEDFLVGQSLSAFGVEEARRLFDRQAETGQELQELQPLAWQSSEPFPVERLYLRSDLRRQNTGWIVECARNEHPRIFRPSSIDAVSLREVHREQRPVADF